MIKVSFSVLAVVLCAACSSADSETSAGTGYEEKGGGDAGVEDGGWEAAPQQVDAAGTGSAGGSSWKSCATNYECGSWTNCRTWSCDAGACVPHDSADGAACESGGFCLGGACVDQIACDDGNPCTSDLYYGGACHFDAVTYAKPCETAGFCAGSICCNGCWDTPTATCVVACPDGGACDDFGRCQK